MGQIDTSQTLLDKMTELQVKPQCTHFLGCASCRSIEDVINVHRVNVLGPLMVTQAMLPSIRKGKRKLVCVSPSQSCMHACMEQLQMSKFDLCAVGANEKGS